MQVFPDTGANLCLMGPAQLKILDLSKDNLAPFSAPITVVGGSTVSASGKVELKLSIGNQSTKQMVYFCDRADRFFLGRQACRDLGIISPSFPYPPGVGANPPEVASLSTDIKREPPPPKPQTIPHEPEAKNIPLLKKFLVKAFSKSTFNRSPPFPKLSTPPAHIYLKPDHKIPRPAYTAAPVPDNWAPFG